jgi:hypothetical protein
VLVVGVEGQGPPPRRRLRRRRPTEADPERRGPEVPVTTLTVVRPEPLGAEEAAARWLESLRADPDAATAEVDAALVLINLAVHAHRTTALDSHQPDVSTDQALAVRVGYGTGDQLADGRYTAALDLPRIDTRRRRADALRPQDRIAAVLGGREEVGVFELPLLRARSDLDAQRLGEAALQLRIGLAALLHVRGDLDSAGQRDDLAQLEERREAVATAARAALNGTLSPAETEAVAETLAICERVLKRRRLS